jgi:predicted short-subunit dehydrogenase-like oxidoreductase (DUF2520 family)
MDKLMDAVSIIGAGNVATHLALNLKNKGFNIYSVSSKNSLSAKVLAAQMDAIVIDDLTSIPSSNLVLLCVNDESIKLIVDQISLHNPIIYTAGNVELSSLPKRPNLGVFYPLQTFSKEQDVQLSEVPFLIEANNQIFAELIFQIAKKISNYVVYADSIERKKLHLGAVFINNFTNHLVYLSKKYLESQQLNWEILQPLLAETFKKLKSVEPYEAQTGPARRNDQETIKDHIQKLEGSSREIYEAISKSILETYQSK